MLTSASLVAIGIGGVGIRRGRMQDTTSTTKEMAANNGAGLRAVLAMMRKTIPAPAQKTALKMITSVTGRGLTSGSGYCSGAMKLIPKWFFNM